MQKVRLTRLGLSTVAVLCTACAVNSPISTDVKQVTSLEINTASQERIANFVGIGPVLASRILRERSTQLFTGCKDLTYRVSGIGQMTAAKLSERGLRVNGETCR